MLVRIVYTSPADTSKLTGSATVVGYIEAEQSALQVSRGCIDGWGFEETKCYLTLCRENSGKWRAPHMAALPQGLIIIAFNLIRCWPFGVTRIDIDCFS